MTIQRRVKDAPALLARGADRRYFRTFSACSLRLAAEDVALSRRKQGFESPRERQCNQTLNPSQSISVQQLSNKRLWTGMDGMQIGQHMRSVWPYRSDLGATLRLAPPKLS